MSMSGYQRLNMTLRSMNTETFVRMLPKAELQSDPAVFGCTLTDELLALVEHQQFTPHELAQLQRNAFRVAKLAEA